MSRVVQLIKRDQYGNDLIVLDVNGPREGEQGVRVLKMEGIHHPPREATDEESAFIEGSVPGVGRTLARIVKLTILTEETDQHPWEWVDSLLWEVMAPFEYWFLRIESKGGEEARELTLRRHLDPEPAHHYDPGEDGKMKWIITATAHDPFFYGEQIVDEFVKTAANGGAGFVWIENPGPREAFLEWNSREVVTTETWTLPDALGKYPVGHPKAGQQVTHTLPDVGPGKHFRVDTHPLAEQLSIWSEAQGWAKMRGEQFVFRVPGRLLAPVQIPVKVVGGTNDWSGVQVIVHTRYDGPWGW